MATRLGHGLVGFSRERIGMRKPRMAYSWAKVSGCSIHHGGPVGGPRMSFKAARDTWLSWQAYHMDKGWSDIGYNLGIDGLGRLYQGRPVGAVPAAVEGHNTGTFAINFMQDGRYHKLNPLQRRTLKVLFEHGAPKWDVPPLKTVRTRVHNEYSGHESNECPGPLIKKHVLWRRGRSR